MDRPRVLTSWGGALAREEVSGDKEMLVKGARGRTGLSVEEDGGLDAARAGIGEDAVDGGQRLHAHWAMQAVERE